MSSGTSKGMCPHCGELFAQTTDLTPVHDYPDATRCEGSEQHWRNPKSDGRLLWNGEPNTHFWRNQ